MPVATTTSWRHAAVSILDYDGRAAAEMSKQFAAHGQPAKVYRKLTEFEAHLGRIRTGHRELFLVDVDFGRNHKQDGLTAVRLVSETREKRKAELISIVLTSHGEIRGEAECAGADHFIVKTSYEEDVLECQLRLDDLEDEERQKINRERIARLTKLAYESLDGKIRRLREGKRGASIQNVFEAVNRPLQWSNLPENERVILSVIRAAAKHASSGRRLRSADWKMLSDGARMLIRGDGQGKRLEKWLAVALGGGAKVLPPVREESGVDAEKGKVRQGIHAE